MKNKSRQLDQTDLDILAALFKDARLSNKDLASQIGLAPSSCLERVKRLQADEVIVGSMMNINFPALGGNIQAMIAVRLSDHSRQKVARFQQEILDQAEVITLFHMGGEDDFFIHVAVSDTHHLRDFVFDKITARSEVNHVETALIYDFQISKRIPSFS